MMTFETLEGLKENIDCSMEDIPYILLIISQELRDIRENSEEIMHSIVNK